MPDRRAIGLLLPVVSALALGACGGAAPRAAVGDAELLDQMGFLRTERVERSLVEGRLGAAQSVFEGGRLVIYRVYESRGRLTQTAAGADADRCFSLVIEYAGDARVQRRALVRVPCKLVRGDTR